MDQSHPQFAKSIETTLIENRLKTAVIGDVVTFKELSALCGCSIHGGHHSMQSARRIMLVRHGKVFESVTKEGYMRLGDIDIVKSSERDVTKLRRASKRAVRRLSAVADFMALPPETRLMHNARMTVLAMTTKLTGRDAGTKIEGEIAKTQRVLGINETLALFSRSAA